MSLKVHISPSSLHLKKLERVSFEKLPGSQCFCRLNCLLSGRCLFHSSPSCCFCLSRTFSQTITDHEKEGLLVRNQDLRHAVYESGGNIGLLYNPTCQVHLSRQFSQVHTANKICFINVLLPPINSSCNEWTVFSMLSCVDQWVWLGPLQVLCETSIMRL